MHIFLLTTCIHHFSPHPALCPTWPNLTCLISTFWSACLILTQEHDSQVWVCIKFLVVLLGHSSHPDSSLSKHHTDPCAFASSSGTLSSHSSGFLLFLFHQTPIFLPPPKTASQHLCIVKSASFYFSSLEEGFISDCKPPPFASLGTFHSFHFMQPPGATYGIKIQSDQRLIGWYTMLFFRANH